MNTYLYTFEVNGHKYHVYAPSKEDAISDYLTENGLKELPKDCIISRTNA